MVPNDSKWFQMVPNSSKWFQTFPNGSKWFQMVPNCSKSFKFSKFFQMVPNEHHDTHLRPCFSLQTSWVIQKFRSPNIEHFSQALKQIFTVMRYFLVFSLHSDTFWVFAQVARIIQAFSWLSEQNEGSGPDFPLSKTAYCALGVLGRKIYFVFCPSICIFPT